MLDAYIYDVVRTPRGRVRRDGGTLSGVAPHELVDSSCTRWATVPTSRRPPSTLMRLSLA